MELCQLGWQSGHSGFTWLELIRVRDNISLSGLVYSGRVGSRSDKFRIWVIWVQVILELDIILGQVELN